MAQRTRVLLVDDEPRVRKGLRMRLMSEPDMDIAGEAETGEDALVVARAIHPDLILMDIHLRGSDGLTATRMLREAGCSCVVIIVTMSDDVATRELARAAGACGFVGKQEGPERLVQVIREAMAEGPSAKCWPA